MRTSVMGGALLAATLVAGCGQDPGTGLAGDAEAPVAIATTTPLGDVLREVVECADGGAATLMSPGDDPHTFAPSSAQVAQLASAEIVVTNGLGLEEGLASAVENAATDGAHVLEIAPLLDPVPLGADDHVEEDHGHEDDHDHEGDDPHVWLDVARMARAAELMGEELAEVTGEEAYATCGAEVATSLEQVDAEVREILSAVPEERRVLVSDHDSFGYFADVYGFDLLGVVIPGGSTDAEPSSQELAALVGAIREAGVPAIFSSTAVDSPLMQAVAGEVGHDVEVVDLYVGSVGPAGSGAETYRDMMLTNARLVADALD